MTNEQAARILRIDTQPQERLKYTYKTWVEVFDEACKMGAEALRGPQPDPDPDTGLVPCGCGGKAKCLHHLTPDGDYAVKCGKCKIMTDWFNSPEDAIKAFNTAMGWKGGAE